MLKKEAGERPGALRARRTRTVKLCSFDARSKGQPGPLPLKKSYKESENFRWALLNGLFEHPAGAG